MQSLFMCNHPELRLLLEGLQEDCQKQKAAFLQGVTGVEEINVKMYCNLIERMKRAVEGYNRTDVCLYLLAISQLLHNADI